MKKKNAFSAPDAQDGARAGHYKIEKIKAEHVQVHNMDKGMPAGGHKSGMKGGMKSPGDKGKC